MLRGGPRLMEPESIVLPLHHLGLLYKF